MKRKSNDSPWVTIIKRIAAERYALRNRTQRLIMGEIVKYHDRMINGNMIHRERYWSDYFRLKHYLFKKYKIY